MTDGRAKKLQIQRLGQAPINVIDCRVIIEGDRVDIYPAQPFDMNGWLTKKLTVSLDRVIIAWEDDQ